MAYVLAGGKGSRLLELTEWRAKPAVHFGGKSRIIDFALSNALNSGIRRIGVATQYKAHSLIRHLQRGWNFFRLERNESFDILPASQRVTDGAWYAGTADAVFQNIDIIQSYAPKYIVILAGDHIYKMDYEPMLVQHVEQNADVTVGCLEVTVGEASAFGIMHVDDNNYIRSFVEKPNNPPTMPGKPTMALASMGVYVFDTAFLFQQLRRDAADPDSSHDFGKDIIPYIVRNGSAVAHHFSRSCVRTSGQAASYWRDVGTLDAYWAANLDLTDIVPQLDLYDRNWPIWTFAEISPPAKFVHDLEGRRGQAVSSLVSGGCIISGASVRQSLLFTNVHLHSYSEVENAVILPEVVVGRGVRLKNVIVDRGVRIPNGLVVGEDPKFDESRFRRTEGRRLLDHPGNDRQIGRMTAITVLAVASEIYPFVKTGGLADVTGALPLALRRHDVETTTLVPGYPAVMAAIAKADQVLAFDDLFGGAARVLRAHSGGLDLLVIDAPHLFDRQGNPYSAPDGGDWPDNAFRFGALAWIAARIGLGDVAGYTPDIIHGHDWQAALAMAYLNYEGKPHPATVLTVHNLAFQGQFPPDLLGRLRLPPHALSIDGVENYGMIGFLKAGLQFADRITTVSPTYAQEIQSSANGCGLDGLLRARSAVLSGIRNGIDTEVWNPETDTRIVSRFGRSTSGGTGSPTRPRCRSGSALRRIPAPCCSLSSAGWPGRRDSIFWSMRCRPWSRAARSLRCSGPASRNWSGS